MSRFRITVTETTQERRIRGKEWKRGVDPAIGELPGDES